MPSIHRSMEQPDSAMQSDTLASTPVENEISAARDLDEDAEMRQLANEHLRNLKQVLSSCPALKQISAPAESTRSEVQRHKRKDLIVRIVLVHYLAQVSYW